MNTNNAIDWFNISCMIFSPYNTVQSTNVVLGIGHISGGKIKASTFRNEGTEISLAATAVLMIYIIYGEIGGRK